MEWQHLLSAMAIVENTKSFLNALPPSVSLVLATKGRTAAEINEAIGAGATIIGENYVQEAKRKAPFIRGKAELHLIGHLQKNKVRRALKVFDMVQTVDSLALAQEISRHAEKPYPILIQVNVGGERQKHGCTPDETAGLVGKISALPNIRVRGLMAMAPHFDDPEGTRPYFTEMNRLFEGIKAKGLPNVSMDILSLGMSDDYKVAVEEGSTMVRLGSAIFGSRHPRQ